MCVCVHRCCHTHWYSHYQLVCVSNVHISPIVINLSFADTHTRDVGADVGVPPDAQTLQASYLVNSLIGPGVQLSDHNVMWTLICAYVVQFERGDAIPSPVITLISGYCALHIYQSNIKLYGRLMEVHKGHNCRHVLACTTMRI